MDSDEATKLRAEFDEKINKIYDIMRDQNKGMQEMARQIEELRRRLGMNP